MSESYAFLNGRFMPASEAQLPLYDAGFVFGATVTDLCRTFRQQLYRWEDHLRRFRASCRLARIDIRIDDLEMSRIAHELVQRNTHSLPTTIELCLVLFATPGPIDYYHGEPGGAGDGVPTFGMHTFPLPFARYRRLVTHGADLIVPTVRQVSASCVDPQIKQRSRMHWWLADREVQAAHPGAQALLIDEHGLVTETAAANFMIVQRGAILSPPAGTVLPGVSLQVVREICDRQRIPFEERPLTIADCLAADEALLTSTPYCIAGVGGLNGKTYRRPGPMLQHLHDQWSADVGMDVHAGFSEAVI
jgi:branched-chain amino acid aminotransferase